MDLLVYVDDLILTNNSSLMCTQVKTYLHSYFHVKDLSPPGLFFSQRKYAFEIVEECRLLGCKPVDFPSETNHKPATTTGPALLDPTHYRRLTGRLYLSHHNSTRTLLCSPRSFAIYAGA